jgi:hypothetical protein
LFTVIITSPVVNPAGTGTTIELFVQLIGAPTIPLRTTVLLPCEEPKFVPLMFMEVPTAATAGEILLMPGVTVKVALLLARPTTVTATEPEPRDKPCGTETAMLMFDQLRIVALTEPKVTVLAPWVGPNAVPVSVTVLPIGPDDGDTAFSVGAIEKFTPLLAAPPTVTTMGPVLAPLGTGATIVRSPQLVGTEETPLKVTALEASVAPKPCPLTVTDVPIDPEDGDTLDKLGTTKKLTALLETPPTVTTIGPVLAPLGTTATMPRFPQLVAYAGIPSKVTVLEPCGFPKEVPLMVTKLPTVPERGEIL